MVSPIELIPCGGQIEEGLALSLSKKVEIRSEFVMLRKKLAILA